MEIVGTGVDGGELGGIGGEWLGSVGSGWKAVGNGCGFVRECGRQAFTNPAAPVGQLGCMRARATVMLSWPPWALAQSTSAPASESGSATPGEALAVRASSAPMSWAGEQ
jgi:hypothetical protein